MKSKIAIVGLLILSGCAHVSVKESQSEDPNANPYVVTIIGTSRGLEKELDKIWDQIEIDPERSEAQKDIINEKIWQIEFMLERRGFIIRRRYVLPSIIGTAIPEPLQIDNLPEEIRNSASPAGRYGFENVDWVYPTNSPLVAVIRDREDNFGMWENFLRSKDPHMHLFNSQAWTENFSNCVSQADSIEIPIPSYEKSTSVTNASDIQAFLDIVEIDESHGDRSAYSYDGNIDIYFKTGTNLLASITIKHEGQYMYWHSGLWPACANLTESSSKDLVHYLELLCEESGCSAQHWKDSNAIRSRYYPPAMELQPLSLNPLYKAQAEEFMKKPIAIETRKNKSNNKGIVE